MTTIMLPSPQQSYSVIYLKHTQWYLFRLIHDMSQGFPRGLLRARCDMRVDMVVVARNKPPKLIWNLYCAAVRL